MLFVEGQMPRGIFVLCKGSVKLSINSPSGRTVIVKLAEPGEVLGLSATISGKPYEVTAETLDPCQVNFVKREDFLRFLKDDVEACFKVAEQLSEKYHNACKEAGSLGLSHSAAEKLAKLLLEWSMKNGDAAKAEPRLKLRLTHEEIAQMIGTSRETVTRLFAEIEEAPDRAVQRLDDGDSQYAALAGNRKPQLIFGIKWHRRKKADFPKTPTFQLIYLA